MNDQMSLIGLAADAAAPIDSSSSCSSSSQIYNLSKNAKRKQVRQKEPERKLESKSFDDVDKSNDYGFDNEIFNDKEIFSCERSSSFRRKAFYFTNVSLDSNDLFFRDLQQAKVVGARGQQGFKWGVGIDQTGSKLYYPYFKSLSAQKGKFRVFPTHMQENAKGNLLFGFGKVINTKSGSGSHQVDKSKWVVIRIP